MSLRPLRTLLHSEYFWLGLGIAIALFWFAQNRMLPGVYRGEVCCDSTHYLNTAGSEKITETIGDDASTAEPPRSTVGLFVTSIFTDASYRTLGYGIFLAAHRYGLEYTGLSAVIPWAAASTVTALVLHILAAWFLFRSLKYLGWNVHPFALFLLVGHPGFVSHAALPLTDSLSTSLVMLGAGSLARSVTGGSKMIYAIATGLLFALAAWVRSANFLAGVAVLGAWMVIAAIKYVYDRSTADRPMVSTAGGMPALEKIKLSSQFLVLSSCLALLSFFIVISPRLIACTRATGSVCFIQPEHRAGMTAELFQIGLRGARTYTALQPPPPLPQWPDRQITVQDAYFIRHFNASCPVTPRTVGHDIARCFSRNWIHLPVFFLKKTIGLFDNFHWNTYATYITPPSVLLWNRTFGAIAFAGFLWLILCIVRSLLHREWPWQRMLFLAFPVAYWAMSALIMVESRYGFPLVPFGIAGFVIALQNINLRERRSLLRGLFLATLIILFITQTVQWDGNDEIPYVELEEVIKYL